MRNLKTKYLLASLMILLALQANADEYADAVSLLSAGDYTAAYRTFKRLAKRDHAEAQFQLGILYLHGKGVDQDVQKGLSWLKRAAEGYSYMAANELSQIYLSGQWVKQNQAEGTKWLELSNRIAAENEGEAEDGCE
jgi:TPR repeat protein